jgi:hypothetical protein
MSSLVIRDLAQHQVLDRAARRAVHGGANWLKGQGPAADVHVNVDQRIVQLQDVRVSALNNVGVIGAGFSPLALDVSPAQRAGAAVGF